MSESMLTAAFIILSGGLQDAYTYCCRDKVFANAQTGNIVLFSAYLFDGDWAHSRRYLVPLISFMAGIFVAECVHRRYKCMEKVHWRQLIILGRDRAAVFCRLPAAGGQHLCKRARLVRLRDAGADLPQGARPRLREHHVHRQHAQRHEALCVYFHTHDREVLHKRH